MTWRSGSAFPSPSSAPMRTASTCPPYDILIRLSALFGVSCDYLLGVCDTPYISTDGLTRQQIEALQKIAQELRQLNQNTDAPE